MTEEEINAQFQKDALDCIARFKPSKSKLLERQGWETWLKTLGPHSFTGEFADFHRDIWDWYWPLTAQQRSGAPMDLEDLTYFAVWGRGLGKSTNAEWLAVAEGCLIGKGFVLYVSGTAEQAEAHVEAIRERIESEGALSAAYSGMQKPEMGDHKKGKGSAFGWRQDYLMTGNGWAVRPVGLDKAIRGWKRGDSRVSLIILDDIDDDDDSPEVILKKERRIAKKILPMGTARTKVVFAQNLIHSNSVLNRMHTRQTDILALRRGDVAIKAFDEIEIEHRQTPKGPRNVIVRGKPTWPYIDMAECQSYLDRSGYDGFLAEYMHDFSGEQADRVLPEYDDRILRLHLITWSQYEKMYGYRRIPSDWAADVGLDIGYTTGHQSSWTFLAKAPDWAELGGSIFRYRGRVFTGTGIDEQSVAIRREMWPQETIEREFMSHEKLGEKNVLNEKHGWHFQPCDSAKTAGLAQWRHHLLCDRTLAHPFHRDEKQPDGLWKLGCPSWFDIVDDDQFVAPRDDKGLKTHRNQAFNWKMRKVEETKSGMTIEQPMKADEDSCFVAGTKITTRYGENVIEAIRPNDVVLTRRGWCRVLVAGKTSSEAEIWEIILSNGTRLSGTKGHPIWVAGYGWKPLSELKAGERLLSLTECDFTVTRIPDIGRTERILSRMCMLFRKAWEHYTLSCGERSMVKSQKIMQSITATITHSIMPIPTLRFSPDLSTVATTETICLPNLKQGCETISLNSKNWLKYGIVATKDESGIESTQKRWDFIPFQKSNWFVPMGIVAVLLMVARFGINTVQEFANSVTTMAWFLPNVNVPYAEDRLPGQDRDVALNAFVNFNSPNQSKDAWLNIPQNQRGRVPVNTAERHFPRLDQTEDSVVVSVRSAPRMIGRERVFNLTVEGASEYFANGVLVHNCDSTRMITVSFGPVSQSMTPAQRIHAIIPKGYHANELALRVDPNTAAMTGEFAEWLAKKSLKQKSTGPVDEFGQSLK